MLSPDNHYPKQAIFLRVYSKVSVSTDIAKCPRRNGHTRTTQDLRFQIAKTTKITVFRDVMPCSLINRYPKSLVFVDSKVLVSVNSPKFGPWPISVKLSVLLKFSRSNTVGRTPWAGDKLVARPLPVHKHIKTHTHTHKH
jgi:hypothetical protein